MVHLGKQSQAHEVKVMKIDEREQLLTKKLTEICAQSYILQENLKQLKEQETIIRNRLNELQAIKKVIEEVRKNEGESKKNDKSK